VKPLDAACEGYRVPLKFRDQQVPRELIETLIAESRKVPYAFYLDPLHVYVATEPEIRNEIAEGCFNHPLVRTAPCVVVYTGYRYAAKEQEAILERLLETNQISIEEAERARQALELHFDISPAGIGWVGKLVGAPIMRLFTSMPQLPAVHKREYLTRQIMRSAMTFFWASESFGLNTKIVESYDEWRIKSALNIPWHHVVVSVMLVGYADKSKKMRSPVDLDEVIHWNKTS
jgi:nitroreductase